MGRKIDLNKPVYCDEIFKQVVLESKSMREVGRKLKCDVHVVSKRIKELDLDILHFINSTVRGKTKYVNYIGKKYGYLIIKDVYQIPNRGGRQYYALCDCSKCGKLGVETLVRWVIKEVVRSCGCLHKDAGKQGANNANWRGYGEIRGNFWSKIVNNSRRANGYKTKEKTFEITIQYGWELFLKQNRRCAISGLSLHMGKHNIRPTASLDRIDSSIGYIEGNVQWVHKDINLMKQSYSDEYFIQMCKQVSNYQEENYEVSGKIGGCDLL